MDEINQQIAEIEEILRSIPHHKGTNHYIGKMRARLSRLKDRQIESEIKSKGGGGGGYAVRKTGDASVVLIGPPSAGKSTLLNQLTNAESRVAEYSFTTVSVIPGMMKYNDAYIQIFDVPGIIEGAGRGKGRGKEVLSVARNSDLLILMTDISRINVFQNILAELQAVGIRVNDTKPEVLIDKKNTGGLSIHTNVRQNLDMETIKEIISEMGLKNADITLKENITIDRLIDSVSVSRVYIPAIVVVNKIDQDPNWIRHYDDTYYRSDIVNSISKVFGISAQRGIGLDVLRQGIWEALELIKIYLVKSDEKPDLSNSFIARNGNSLREVMEKLGSDFAESKKLAKIWGSGASFPGQEVSLEAKVKEGMQVRFV